MEDHYRDRGFAVAGFYSNNFGRQGGSDEQIAGVTERYGVKHDQYAVADVVGDSARPVWAWLLGHDNPGPKPDALAPNWNFCKYLISRSGELVAAFGTRAYAGRDHTSDEWLNSPVIAAIEAELAK